MRERRAGITAGELRNEFHEERNRVQKRRNEHDEGGFVVNSSMERNETDMLLENGVFCVLAGVQQRRGVLATWLLLPQTERASPKGPPITLCSDDCSEIKGGGKPID